MKKLILISILFFVFSLPLNAHISDTLISEYGNIPYINKIKIVKSTPLDLYYETNCVPSAIANCFSMIGYQYKSVEEIRLKLRNKPGGVYSYEVDEYLYNEYINNGLIYDCHYIKTIEDIDTLLKNKHILITTVDTNNIKNFYNINGTCFGKDYLPATNMLHSFVIVDKYIIDGISYYAVVDNLNSCVRLYESTAVFNTIKSSGWDDSVYSFDVSKGISILYYSRGFILDNLTKLKINILQ